MNIKVIYTIGLSFCLISLIIFLVVLVNNPKEKINIYGITTGDIVSLTTPLLPATNTTYNTKIWSTNISTTPLNIAFPEQCIQNMYGNSVPNINKVSICISGGGSRSCIASVGYFRALNRMGYKNKAQYVSTTSGGSWFYGPYTFYEGKNGNVDDLLGQSSGLNSLGIPETSKLTLEQLLNDNKNNTKYFGTLLLTKGGLGFIFNSAITGNPNNSFSIATGKILLEPLGLNSEVPISLNILHANEMSLRNIFNGIPIYPLNNSPFWICNTNLMFDFNGQYPYCVVPMTPLYSGIPQTIIKNNNKIGGVVVETFSFGNSSSPATELEIANTNCLNSYIVNLNRISNMSIITLKDLIGASSIAYAIALYKPELFIGDTLGQYVPEDFKDLIPLYNIWGSKVPAITTSDSQCTVNLIKGGCNAPSGYDPNTCTKYGSKCYSNSAPQCKTSDDCKYSLFKFECVNNKTGSSLNCRTDGFFKCKCVSTQYPAQEPKPLNLQLARIGDGGYTDQLSIIPLVARGVKKIISFANLLPNTSTVFSSGTDMENYFELQQLFGVAPVEALNQGLAGGNTAQIFNSIDYKNKLMPALKTSVSNGGPCFARVTLDVISNPNNGVLGGYQVDILFLLLYPLSKRFYDSLTDQKIKDNITSSKIGGGLFNNFPIYKTFFQNASLGVIDLTLGQSNLLSTYTDWCLNQPEVKVHVNQLFSY